MQQQEMHHGDQSKYKIKQYYPFYSLKKKLMVSESGLFKIKMYNQNDIIFTASQVKCVAIADQNLKIINKYYYKDQPHALDVITMGDNKLVACGFGNGNICVTSQQQIDKQRIRGKGNVNQQQSVEATKRQQIELKAQDSQQVFVNEITHLKENPNIMLNCYNNGSVAVWGLMSGKRIHTLKKLHHKYTYKIRIQQSNILVSCGNDANAIRTDLQKMRPVSIFRHPLPVWCAYPLNPNQIATVGLFGRVFIWDSRCSRIVQACNNSGRESSFITCRNPGDLQTYYGDEGKIMKWDRRAYQSQEFTQHQMSISTEAILFNKNKMFLCGRGRDICLLQGQNQLVQLQRSQIIARTKIITLKEKQSRERGPRSIFQVLMFQQFQSQQSSEEQQEQQQVYDGEEEGEEEEEEGQEYGSESEQKYQMKEQNQISVIQKQTQKIQKITNCIKLPASQIDKYKYYERYWAKKIETAEQQSDQQQIDEYSNQNKSQRPFSQQQQQKQTKPKQQRLTSQEQKQHNNAQVDKILQRIQSKQLKQQIMEDGFQKNDQI